MAKMTIGTSPPGRFLIASTVFVIYLEAAHRDIRGKATAMSRLTEVGGLTFETVDADDTDYVSTATDWLRELEPVVITSFGTER